MEQNRRRDDDLSQRVAATESDLRHVREDVEKLSDEVHSGFSGLNRGLTDLGDKLSAKDRTPWGVVISAITLMVTIISLIGYLGVAMPLQGLAAEVSGQSEMLFDHITSAGHPAITEKVESNSVSITDLDTTLQREMRLLDRAMQESLQTQIDLKFDTHDREITRAWNQIQMLNSIELDNYKNLLEAREIN